MAPDAHTMAVPPIPEPDGGQSPIPEPDGGQSPIPEPVPRSAAAERMRRHRSRRRSGLRCLTIELRDTELVTLVRMGLLKADLRRDPSAVKNALYTHLDRTLVWTR